MPTILLTTFSYIKKYWVILAATFAFIVFRFWQATQQQQDIAKILDEIAKQRSQELKDIQNAHDVEEKQRQLNEQKLKERLNEIEKQYENAKQLLDAQKRIEIQQIIETTQDNPELLAKKLSDATGFQIYITKE